MIYDHGRVVDILVYPKRTKHSLVQSVIFIVGRSNNSESEHFVHDLGGVKFYDNP